MKNYGPGFTMRPNNWGRVEKCLYCDKTDIERTGKFQVTCGGDTCKEKHKSTLRRRREGSLPVASK